VDAPELVVKLEMGREVNNRDHEHQLKAAVSYYFDLNRLSKLPHDTLIMHSRDDPIVHFANAMIMKESIRNSRLVEIERGGHMFHRTHPEKVAQITNNFLDQQGRSRPESSISFAEQLMQFGTIATIVSTSWLT
jgi:pimeloyl-ACP methyl ester carboxylesterase